MRVPIDPVIERLVSTYWVFYYYLNIHMQKIIFLDTETWWLDWDTDALLTVAYSTTSQLYDVMSTHEFKLPIKGTINQSALDINWLDVSNWLPNATMESIVDRIEDEVKWLEEFALYWHNIFFDLNFIRSHDKKSYERLMSIFRRNIVDTKSLFIQLVQDYKYDWSCSMHKIMENSDIHTAWWDTKLNAELMKKYSILNKKQ